MNETKTLKVGDIAPDFTLCDQHNRPFRLQAPQGKKVLIASHPLAWTHVCSQQMKDLEAARAELESLNAVAVGLSVDAVPSSLRDSSCARATGAPSMIHSGLIGQSFMPFSAMPKKILVSMRVVSRS